MNIKWLKIKEIILVYIIEFISYFLITIIILSSLGVWLPLSNDKAQFDKISNKAWKASELIKVSFSEQLQYHD
jgi:hypothetical protein